MRISDWSSDVCSSDLSGCTISDPPPDRTGDVAVVINGLNKHFGGAPALQDLSAQIRYGRLTGLVGPAIGRASCRERVWQYVSISVVAGSLKKHTNIPRYRN